VLIYQLH